MTEVSAEPGVRTELSGSTYTVVLDAPERDNRINVRAMKQLIEGLNAATRDNALVLLIRAAGRDFSLGRLQGEQGTGLTRVESLRLILEANRGLRSFPGVSVCAVQGRAFGFGTGLAVQADLTVAEDSAVFAFDEVLHGLAPLVVAEYLGEFIGRKVAAELVLTGREVPAAEALRLGMVNEVVSTGRLDARIGELLEHLGSLEPGALRLMKRYLGELHAATMTDPKDDAVVLLDHWLEAGRPALPRSETRD